MKLDVLKIDGSKAGNITADKTVFGIEPNAAVVRQAVLAEMTNMRQGTHASKNRAQVRGGGKKPFKQKGRGVATAGTIRSPLWKGGGVVFGPEPHGYSHKIPKKMSKLARKSVISKKIKDGDIIVLDNIEIDSKKTSNFKTFLKNIKIDQKKTLILVSSFQENLILASRNIRNVFIENARSVSVYDLLDTEVVLIDKEGVKILSKVLA